MSNWTTTTNFHCHFINPSITCNTDKQYSRNITSNIPVTGLAKHFLTEHMLNSVLEHTNKRMNYLIRYLPDNFNENRLYPFVKLFSFDELMAFSVFFCFCFFFFFAMDCGIRRKWLLGEPVVMTFPQFLHLPCLETDFVHFSICIICWLQDTSRKIVFKSICCLPRVLWSIQQATQN